jgi:hypothetical protein
LSPGFLAPNGFVALAEFDKKALGGNQDGVIDALDPVFKNLRIWIDRNHDGHTDPGELLTLPQAGVRRIELVYSRTGREDGSGNLFRFKGRAWILNPAGREHSVPIYDVFFVKER